MNSHLTLSKSVFMLLAMLTFIPFESCNENASNGNREDAKALKKIDLQALNISIAEKFDSNAQTPFMVWEQDTLDKLSLFKEVYINKSSLWLNENGINKQGSEFLKVLNDLKNDGMDIEQYHTNELVQLSKEVLNNANTQNTFSFETKLTNAFLSASRDMLMGSRVNKNKEIKNANDSLINEADILKLAIKNDQIVEAFEYMRPKHPWYKKFREAYIHLSAIQLKGGLQTITSLKDSMAIGDSSLQIAVLRKRLYSEIKTPSDTISTKWDMEIQESLKKFQHLNQLKVTGFLDTSTLKKLNTSIDQKLAKLALNMERMRWLKHDFKQPYIWVAIPKMEMDYVENNTIGFNMRVVVGKPSRATPALDANIKNIVLSPPWNVPPTIMREEVVPGIARRGGAYLARRGLKAYDRRGRVVSASAINARNYRNFSIGQAPGYRSSLGEVKFNMPNPWAIYMHDTPHREDFVKSYRAFSSGCVRVHKPKEFATFLLRDSVQYSYEKIDSICKLRKTVFIPIERNINVHFVYLTTALDSVGNVMYLKDIYGWD
ncbi:MAG: L,D-transpeptidase family protein [Bacteroidetes bacterium]|jgi:murein L,D-transpeptidase YcbB/YkuD|nr:L,D-transpeptidase family protein [Bacteroidota bacterium]MBK8328158.1 L,D-transpeptidase family protein [Bacteroidota bacterium]MBK9482292.1 L,D-transpeptidase family protein [Bacteroidota bacterium]HQW45839.1 L,D-transpeptidase family protein [Chitinophagaceae bacterium]